VNAVTDAPLRGSTAGIDTWRASALGTLLAWTLASAAASATLLTSLAAGDPAHRTVLIAGWGLVAALGALLLARRLPWRLRAALFLSVNIGAVVLSATSLRPSPIGFTIALATVALAGLLLGTRTAVGAAALVTAILGGAALASAAGWTPPRPPLPAAGEWGAALVGSIPAVVVVVLALRSIVGRLEAALDEAVGTVAELEAARARLLESEKAELAGKLSRALAHDLNNTLTVVMANAEWLTERLDDHEAVEAASQICEAARNAATLTQYALLASRGGLFQPRPIDVTRATAVAAGALRRLLPPDIAVEARLNGPVWAHFDPGQFQQVLLSLAFNARGAMPGGGSLILAVRPGGAPPRTPGDPPPAAILEVADNGLGMDAEERRRAFDPLSAGGRPGAGYGLSGVKAVVEGGGGEVAVRSRPGAGTVFTITLPGAAAALPPEAERATRRARVLVVEDDIRVRALVCTALAEDGHEVSEVSDGTQAMRAIEELSGIDLLVTDVVMPGAPIGEVLTTFRSRHPAARILVCSAFSEDEALRQRVNAGEYRLLPKPFSRSDLLAEVRSLLATAGIPDLPAQASPRVGALA
jgi:signal transduction histidine kinase/ActR/RegA family two-component response regulator